MDLEETKSLISASSKIYKEANQDKYLGSALAKIIEKSLSKVVPIFAGFYAGLNDSQGIDTSLPVSIASASIVANGLNSYVNQVLASKNINDYLSENIKITKDKAKIRETLDQMVASMTGHEKNNYALTDKAPVVDKFIGHIDMSDFVLKQYLSACKSGNESQKTKIVQNIDEMVIEDKLNLTLKEFGYLKKSIHPKSNNIVGGIGLLQSSLSYVAGYGLGRIVGFVTN